MGINQNRLTDRQTDRAKNRSLIIFQTFPNISALQGLRALAFVCIFLHHSGLHHRGLQGTGPLGPFGVSIFLILSGFLMGGSYLGNNKEAKFGLKFVINKISGLYPLHIITMFIMIGYLLITDGFSLLSWLYGLVANILMIVPYCGLIEVPITMQDFNGPSWYLAICVLSYLAFPLILKIMRSYRSRKIAYLVVLFGFVTILLISFASKQAESSMQKYWTYNFPLFRLPEFVIGCNLGYIFVTKIKTNPNKKYLTLIALSITLASWYIYDNNFFFLGQEYFKYTALFVLPSALLVYSLANDYYITNIWKSKIAVKIGDLSPYAFLLHLPIIYSLRLLFGAWDIDLRILLLSFVVTLLLSDLYHRVYQSLKKRVCSLTKD